MHNDQFDPARPDMGLRTHGIAGDGFGRWRTRLEHSLSGLMHFSTRIRLPMWKNWQMRWFIGRYGVNMSEALEQDIEAYPDFNTFFTRALRPGARSWPTEAGVLAAPADGVLSGFDRIDGQTLIQAKGMPYDLSQLLGGDSEWSKRFSGGRYFAIYLAPHNYHRVHMPLTGQLQRMHYVPGRLFSVSLDAVARVPALFARNERVVSLFETEHGAMAVVLVGAVFVGAIEQSWSGMAVPPRARSVQTSRYEHMGEHAPSLDVGDEMGRFHMGSTVVTLLESPSWKLEHVLSDGAGEVKVGEAVARHKESVQD